MIIVSLPLLTASIMGLISEIETQNVPGCENTDQKKILLGQAILVGIGVLLLLIGAGIKINNARKPPVL